MQFFLNFLAYEVSFRSLSTPRAALFPFTSHHILLPTWSRKYSMYWCGSRGKKSIQHCAVDNYFMDSQT
jgi:hypothetical protein